MKEFRVSVPNEPGQLALVSAALSQKLVNIRTVAGFGAAGPVVTFITDHDGRAREALDELGLRYEEVEVLTVTLSDKPGELARISRTLADAHLNIDSIYVLSNREGLIDIALTVNDPDKARAVLGLRG